MDNQNWNQQTPNNDNWQNYNQYTQQDWNQTNGQSQNQCTWQQTQYNNSQPIYTNQIPIQTPLTPQKQPKRKKPRRKKHRFLKFILFIILVILSIKGMNFLAERDMQKFISAYPFIFTAEHNNINYITDDFSVHTQYEIDNKIYKVDWKSNSKNVNISSDGIVTIKRPQDANEKVIITQTYTKLLGKATKTYEIELICTSNIDVENTDIVTLDEIKSNEYNREITASMTQDGEQLDFLMGDFGNTYIQSVDDALAFINLYRKEFNVVDTIEFKFNKISSTDTYKTFMFNVYNNKFLLEDSSAILVVNKDNSKVVKISIDIEETNDLTEINENLDYESIVNEYINLNDPKTASDEYLILNDDYTTYNNISIKKMQIASKLGYVMEMYIDCTTGDVVKYFENVSSANYNKATCTASNDNDETIEFEASYKNGLIEKCYLLYDNERDIHSVDNYGNWELLIEAQKTLGQHSDTYSAKEMWIGVKAIIARNIADGKNKEIKSDTSDFSSNYSAAKAFNNTQIAYDYFVDVFNRYSYDGNGAQILILNNCGNATDNASWSAGSEAFYINPVENFKYSLGNHIEVMGHEYTHAVFGQFAGGSNEEVAGLNEAYADIFGCLIADSTDWVVAKNMNSQGQKVYVRDLATINDTSDNGGYKQSSSARYSEKYNDESWEKYNKEEHIISTVISNIGYKMFKSEYFSNNDIAKIWYNSLGLGYNSSSTYVTCRQNVIATAEQLEYSDEEVDFIAKCFDEADILDPNYVFKTTSNSVDGDDLYDNIISRKHIVIFPLADLVLGDGTIIFFVENSDTSILKPVIKHKIMSEKLTELFNKHETWGEMNIYGKDLTVEYFIVNSETMKVLEKMSLNLGSTVKGMALEKMSQSGVELEGAGEILDILTKLMFKCFIVNDTAYGVYSDLGLIQ